MSLSKFVTTNIPESTQKSDVKDVVGFIKATKERWETGRQTLEEVWIEAWASYLGTPAAQEELRSQALKTVGDVEVDWRHKINVGKGFEAIETIHSYLMSATFPNRNWFSAEPTEPGYSDYAHIIQQYTANKLEAANFMSHYANWLRQLLIVGTSVIALPWRYETIKYKKRIKVMEPQIESWTLADSAIAFQEVEVDKVIANQPDFEVLDTFDVYLDPTSSNANDSALLRRIVKTRADVLDLVRRGVYDATELDIMKLPSTKHASWRSADVKRFQGIELDTAVNLDDEIELWEYWGDVYLSDIVYRDVVVLISGDLVLRFESNPYWAGKPFIVGTYIPLAHLPYAIGAIQPNLGLLHELNIITNQRLDNLELSVDTMWIYVDDGILDPSDLYTKPGRVIQAGSLDNIKPIQHSNQFAITYQEAQYLENKINSNFGTPPLISNGEVRAGERVTAAEIQAVKDAGGNRLSGIHKHIEDTSLRLLLSKLFRLMQQFVNESEMVKVTGEEPGTIEYYQVDPDTFMFDFLLKPVGADHVIDRQKYIQDRTEFISLVAQIPQMADKINYEAILLDILQQYGFDDPERYINSEPAQPQQPAQIDPNAGVKDELRQMGGDHLVSALQAQEGATGDPIASINAMLGAKQPSENNQEVPEEDLLMTP